MNSKVFLIEAANFEPCRSNPNDRMEEIENTWRLVQASYAERKWEYRPVIDKVHQIIFDSSHPEQGVETALEVHRNLIRLPVETQITGGDILKIMHGTILVEKVMVELMLIWPPSVLQQLMAGICYQAQVELRKGFYHFIDLGGVKAFRQYLKWLQRDNQRRFWKRYNYFCTIYSAPY